jgi:hypothetical protein
MRAALGLATLVALLAVSISATAQNFASVDSAFRLEWTAGLSPKGQPRLSGYVHNTTNRRAVRMRLGIDGLDPAGNVVAHTETWVLASVPPNNRAYFETLVPAAVDYRVAVLRFDWADDDDSGIFRRW